MLIIQDNTYTKIKFDNESEGTIDYVNDYLYNSLEVMIKGAEHSPAFRAGSWDGMKHFYDKKDQTFPTGLLVKATNLLDKIKDTYEFDYKVVDNRPDRFIDPTKIPDDLTVYKGEDTIHLRDYQVKAVKGVFESGMGGIVNSSVGSGKSFIGASIIKQMLPELEYGERILFFTNNKEIFRQDRENLEDALKIKVGYLGGGKKKMAQVMVVMIPTVNSYLSIDPEAGISLSAKEQQIKKMARKYKLQFSKSVNPYKSLVSFVNLYKPIKKVDYATKEILEDIRDSCGSNEDVIKAFEEYEYKYQQIINKKSGDLVKKKKFITDLLDSCVAFIADECLVGDTLVSMIDGTYKHIKDLKVGDNTKLGGKVLHLNRTKQGTVTIKYGSQSITGSITHPLLVAPFDKQPVYKPMFSIKTSDYLVDDNGYRVSIDDITYQQEELDLYDVTTENHIFVANGIISHNCHHSKADTWYNTLLACKNAIYKVGLTGSIDRTDEMTVTRLEGVFSRVVVRVKAKELVDRGILATPKILVVPIDKPDDISGLKRWQDVYKAGIVENSYRNEVIAALAAKWYNEDKTTLIIVSQLNHSENISKLLDEYNVPHETINGTQEDDNRKQELINLKNGTNRVLIATSVLDEGVDISNIDTLILAAGGKSVRQVIQRVGRVLRKKVGKENKALIVDFMDNTSRYLRKHSKDRIKIYQEEEFDTTIIKN